jgi:hypothetical protein
MISFMTSVVPPKMNCTRLAVGAHHCIGEQRTGVPAGQGGLHLGRREPRRSRGAIWAAITRQGIVSPRRNSPSRGVAPTTTPNQRPRMSQPSMRTSMIELIAAQLPQVVAMHDASDGSQMGSGSGEPPRGNQDLGRVQDS